MTRCVGTLVLGCRSSEPFPCTAGKSHRQLPQHAWTTTCGQSWTTLFVPWARTKGTFGIELRCPWCWVSQRSTSKRGWCACPPAMTGTLWSKFAPSWTPHVHCKVRSSWPRKETVFLHANLSKPKKHFCFVTSEMKFISRSRQTQKRKGPKWPASRGQVSVTMSISSISDRRTVTVRMRSPTLSNHFRHGTWSSPNRCSIFSASDMPAAKRWFKGDMSKKIKKWDCQILKSDNLIKNSLLKKGTFFWQVVLLTMFWGMCGSNAFFLSASLVGSWLTSREKRQNDQNKCCWLKLMLHFSRFYKRVMQWFQTFGSFTICVSLFSVVMNTW